MRSPFSMMMLDAFSMTMLASRSARPEWAPPPTDTRSVSPVTSRTLSNGTPSHSVISCAKLVSCPWPCDTVPTTTSISPPPSRLYGDLGPLARRAGGGVDVIGDADAAALAALARLGAAGRKALPIGESQHPLHDLMVVAAVVDHAERVGVRHHRFRHEVAPAQLDAVDAGLARRQVDQPLHDEHHLGPAGAAIGAGRHGVGQRGAGAEIAPPACGRCST